MKDPQPAHSYIVDAPRSRPIPLGEENRLEPSQRQLTSAASYNHALTEYAGSQMGSPVAPFAIGVARESLCLYRPLSATDRPIRFAKSSTGAPCNSLTNRSARQTDDRTEPGERTPTGGGSGRDGRPRSPRTPRRRLAPCARGAGNSACS